MTHLYNDPLKRVGARIRQRRKELGLTQEALGHPAYSKSYISQLENGQTWPSLPALLHIADRLGCSPAWLLAEDPDPTPRSSLVDDIARDAGVTPETVRAVLEALMRRVLRS